MIKKQKKEAGEAIGHIKDVHKRMPESEQHSITRS